MEKVNWIVVLFSAILLLILICAIKYSRLFNLYDHILHHKLVHKRDGFGWQIIAFLNDPKLMVIWAVLLASVLLNNDEVILALWVLATLGFADATGIVLKKYMHRQRPYKHSALENGYSFPSGHVLGATTMGLILIQLFGTKYGLGFISLLIIIWMMVVISRLSLKAHYPSDIIGATSLAICCFSITTQIFMSAL
ncbi:phosphatase PAP2 family protein [Lactobacillus sp. PSON]|uniref:phosphatase PAP2 family protein n=1 Tax=Lactobacillus sp. PSON TaxID=3455454 RepID=UPI004042E955